MPPAIWNKAMTPFDFSGQWVGESMRSSAPDTDEAVLLWRIALNANAIFIYPRTPDGAEDGYFSGQLNASRTSFILNASAGGSACVARVLDRDHFVLPAFDAHPNPPCDVVFSRPGLAELSARAVWKEAIEQ
jgi:hypothetical protein